MVDTPKPTPRVLVIGFDPYRVPGPWDPKPAADGIAAGMAQFAEHGVGAEACLRPAGSTCPEPARGSRLSP